MDLLNLNLMDLRDALALAFILLLMFNVMDLLDELAYPDVSLV